MPHSDLGQLAQPRLLLEREQIHLTRLEFLPPCFWLAELQFVAVSVLSEQFDVDVGTRVGVGKFSRHDAHFVCCYFLLWSLVFFEGCEYIFEPLVEFDHVGSRDVWHVLKFFHSNVHCLHLCNVLLEISFQCLQPIRITFILDGLFCLEQPVFNCTQILLELIELEVKLVHGFRLHGETRGHTTDFSGQSFDGFLNFFSCDQIINFIHHVIVFCENLLVLRNNLRVEASFQLLDIFCDLFTLSLP